MYTLDETKTHPLAVNPQSRYIDGANTPITPVYPSGVQARLGAGNLHASKSAASLQSCGSSSSLTSMTSSHDNTDNWLYNYDINNNTYVLTPSGNLPQFS